jgi:hypothetical protein
VKRVRLGKGLFQGNVILADFSLRAKDTGGIGSAPSPRKKKG